MRSRKLAIFVTVTIVVLVGLGFLGYYHPGASRERTGVPRNGKVDKSDAEWRELLTEEQYRVTRLKATERAFTGAYWKTKDDGVYVCVCCGQPLFDSKTKFDSGTGWPSYSEPIDDDNVSLLADNSGLMPRTEVICSSCDAHLGHAFCDGPQANGTRFCINSAALKFVPREGGK